jgi:mannose-6-phosphate isomerase-like protein (cupin superfamily)
MRIALAGATMHGMIETATSVTVIHGATLSFETVDATDAAGAAVRMHEHHETLLRVIDGAVTLELNGSERTLMLEGEARIGSGVPHRLWSAGAGEARIVQELRRIHYAGS